MVSSVNAFDTPSKNFGASDKNFRIRQKILVKKENPNPAGFGFCTAYQRKPRRVRGSDAANGFHSIFRRHVVRSGKLCSAAEASSPAAHPLTQSSSQNQSGRFDFERSGSGMSLLSRLRGSKEYGTCRDAAGKARRDGARVSL